MKKNLTITLIFCSSILVSCSSSATKVRMLNERANYKSKMAQISSVQNKELNRQPSKKAKVYVVPHELPSGDYFHGGWMEIIYEKEKWTN